MGPPRPQRALKSRRLVRAPGAKVAEEPEPSAEGAPRRVDPDEFLALVERMEHVSNTVEILLERTNTLGRLLDVLNKRVDRLESRV